MVELMILVGIASFIFFQGVFREMKSRSLINEWANKNDLVIITLNRCSRWRCYMKYMRLEHAKIYGKGQTLFHMTVKHEETVKEAYAVCGSFWTGLLNNKIEIVWS